MTPSTSQLVAPPTMDHIALAPLPGTPHAYRLCLSRINVIGTLEQYIPAKFQNRKQAHPIIIADHMKHLLGPNFSLVV